MAYKEVVNMAENREKDESRRFDLFGDNSTGTGKNLRGEYQTIYDNLKNRIERNV